MVEQIKTGNEDMSIEDILGSIRKIISEDDENESPADATPESDAEEVVFTEGAEDDILELTQKAEEEPASIEDISFDAPAPQPEQVSESEPEPDADEHIIKVEVAAEPEAAPAAAETDDFAAVEETVPAADTDKDTIMSEESDENTLLSPDASDIAASALNRLVKQNHLAMSTNAVLLDDLVREMLQPMLKEWLNVNLPVIVRELVERELDKLGRRVNR